MLLQDDAQMQEILIHQNQIFAKNLFSLFETIHDLNLDLKHQNIKVESLDFLFLILNKPYQLRLNHNQNLLHSHIHFVSKFLNKLRHYT